MAHYGKKKNQQLWSRSRSDPTACIAVIGVRPLLTGSYTKRSQKTHSLDLSRHCQCDIKKSIF